MILNLQAKKNYTIGTQYLSPYQSYELAHQFIHHSLGRATSSCDCHYGSNWANDRKNQN